MVQNNSVPKERDFRVGQPPITAKYVPSVYMTNWSYFAKVPPFTLLNISNMMADFRVRWGLWMLKGPILANAKFLVKTDNSEVKQFLIKQVTRFWRTSASRVLKAIEWGYSCSEVLYQELDGQIQFDYLKDLHSLDCRALTRQGTLSAARVLKVPGKPNVVLYGPRKLWHTHGRDFNPYYGQSRLYGAYMPWIEIWGDGGYRDCRRLFMHKYAYDGGTLYVPNGASQIDADASGNPKVVANMTLGREIIEKKRTGGVMVLPGQLDERQQRAWEYIPPGVTDMPQAILEYGETLKDEIWEGLGIPPEIARAEGTGAFAGRVVPLIGFYSLLQELVTWLIHDADEQVFRPMVDFNYGPNIQYEIIPFNLLDEAMAKEQKDSGGGLPQNPMPEANSFSGGKSPPGKKDAVMSVFQDANAANSGTLEPGIVAV